jgi:hypothetical protein
LTVLDAPTRPSFHPALWGAVDALLDRSGLRAELPAHGLHLLTARRLRVRGLGVPEELALAEDRAAAVGLASALVLDRARAAYAGTMVLLKGLEVAMRYPKPTLRPFGDLDLLVDRPADAQRALLAAGFETVRADDSDYADLHHLRPLHLRGFPVLVEIHRRPEWIPWAPAPSSAELLSETVESATGIAGVRAL